MKNLFYIVALCAVLTTSCTNKESHNITPIKEQDTDIVDLKNDLLALNNEMFGEQIETKAKWWKYLLTAIADAGVGLITGNIGYAISASSLTWTVFKNSVETSEGAENHSINDDKIALAYLEIADEEEELNDGTIHNKVIINLYNKYGEELFNKSEEVLIQNIAKEVAILTGCSAEEIFPDIHSAKSEMAIYTNAYIESKSIDEYINHLIEYKPEKSEELEILKIALEGFQFVDAETDNGEYASRVTEIIYESNISPEMKEDLRSGVSVANASIRLWNTDGYTEE